MRAITVRQPWAWQIINQGKDVENRTRNIAGKYRGPVAIHAGLKADERALRDLPAHAPEWVTAPRVFDYGVILGVVDLVDVHHCFNAHTNFEGCSPWAQADHWHLVLANPRPIFKNHVANPGIPCRGALGLWTPPADTIEQITAAVSPPPKVLGAYDPAANGYDLTKDPRCLFGWGPPPEKNLGTPESCRCSWGHGCVYELGHPGKCWDGIEDGAACSRAQRPADWDATGRMEANT